MSRHEEFPQSDPRIPKGYMVTFCELPYPPPRSSSFWFEAYCGVRRLGAVGVQDPKKVECSDDAFEEALQLCLLDAREHYRTRFEREVQIVDLKPPPPISTRRGPKLERWTRLERCLFDHLVLGTSR